MQVQSAYTLTIALLLGACSSGAIAQCVAPVVVSEIRALPPDCQPNDPVEYRCNNCAPFDECVTTTSCQRGSATIRSCQRFSQQCTRIMLQGTISLIATTYERSDQAPFAEVHNVANMVIDMPCRGFVRCSGSVQCFSGEGTVRFRHLTSESDLFRSAGAVSSSFDVTQPHDSTRLVVDVDFSEVFWSPLTPPYSTNTSGNYTVTLEFFRACIGDFNFDGGVDGADVEAFFLAWEVGDSSADVNCDGGVDGSDVETFFRTWANGC